MSDLIDFENPASKPQLALPLIPAPEAGSSAQPLTEPLRRSLGDNNPFDMVMKSIVEFEKNQEDPFERVAQKAMGSSAGPEPKMNLSPREEADMSIITDLDDTNLLEDGRHVQASGSRDNVAPNINISLANCSGDLSILDTSALNDSLVDSGSSARSPGGLDKNLYSRSRFVSENRVFSTSELLPQSIRRSLSVTEGFGRSIAQDNTLASTFFEDPLNNAFRRTSTTNSSCSYVNSQLDFSVNKLKIERLNSDSSVFSGLSNISAIPSDQISRDKLCSENSVFSNSSNLSAIPINVSLCDSKVFSNDTINRGFINSGLTLNSTSSTVSSKSPMKSVDRSDLIKKFYEIKNRMSTSQMELSSENKEKKETEHSCNISKNETGVSDGIIQEASRMAQMFEKMPLGKESHLTNEDDLLLSKTQFNFEVLPDDESVDNLIDLPTSPIKTVDVPQKNVSKENKNENSIISPKPNIKALENEFLKEENSNKKAAATLLLELQKFIKVDNNPGASKILNDLQKLMGVDCDNNTEILQLCLQNSNVPQDNQKFENKTDIKENVPDNIELSKSKECNDIDNKSASSSITDDSENDHSNADSADSGINDANDSSDKPTDNVTDNTQKKNQSEESKVNSDESSEDQKLTMNLLHALNKVVSQKSENSAMDVLFNLGAVLNMAAELRTKLKDKENSPKGSEKNVPKRLNRSASFVLKPSPKKYPQNKSLEILPGRPSPVRRSVSIHPMPSPSFLDVKDKSKAHLLNIKKQFSSDPGFAKPDIEKKKSPKKVTESQSNLIGKPTVDPIKSKFKKKLNTEVIAKKGPLKAVIPLGSMQKRASMSQRSSVTGDVTPPKLRDSAPKSHIVSSTPNTNATSNDTKSKPAAASTPNIGSKAPRTSVKYQQSKIMSPMTFNTSLKANTSASKTSPKNGKKLERTMSPQKRPSKNSESTSSSPQWPRVSPRSLRVRNHSMNELKTSKSPPPNNLIKTSSERKLHRHSTMSPLRTSNTLTNKSKPSSLISRPNKRASMQTDPEKENYV